MYILQKAFSAKFEFHSNFFRYPKARMQGRSAVKSALRVRYLCASLSSRSCLKCTTRILTSCKALQEVKQAAQAGPSLGNQSLKRLAKNSPSAGPCVSVDGSNSHRVHSQRRARKKLSLGKENLPANVSVSGINRVTWIRCIYVIHLKNQEVKIWS